ncbi:effector-associated domain EAD1-containing protein [Streptomyces sp. NPDC047000]|uniref:effector-associated domain EAD1-containing protein n=1 Tax=Streptomyces sp. NPDC047000 TaxID=3155474 RepID=UPI0033F6E3C0
MLAGFSEDEQAALSKRYKRADDVYELLDRAGFPTGHIPAFRSPQSFWYEISRELENGVMVDGREKILAVVRLKYPSLQIGQNPPDPQPPPIHEPLTTSQKVLIVCAAITALGAIIAATVTGLFGLMKDDSPSDSKASASASASASTLSGPTSNAPSEYIEAARKTVSITPSSGPVGTTIDVVAPGFQSNEPVTVELQNGEHLQKFLGPYGAGTPWSADSTGTVKASVTVDPEICCAGGKLNVVVTSSERHTRGASGLAIFTITK